MKMNKILYILIQCTWGIPQTLIFGPSYLIVMGIPSTLWGFLYNRKVICNKKYR